jgi:hypothetical protein
MVREARRRRFEAWRDIARGHGAGQDDAGRGKATKGPRPTETGGGVTIRVRTGPEQTPLDRTKRGEPGEETRREEEEWQSKTRKDGTGQWRTRRGQYAAGKGGRCTTKPNGRDEAGLGNTRRDEARKDKARPDRMRGDETR